MAKKRNRNPSSLNVNSGSLHTEGDAVAGDKILNQTIGQVIVLGHILDALRLDEIAGLKIDPNVSIANAESLENVIRSHFGQNIINEMDFAVAVLEPFLKPFVSELKYPVFRFRQFLQELIEYLVVLLRGSGHWDAFYSKEWVANLSLRAEVLWLESSRTFRRKKFRDDLLFGLASHQNQYTDATYYIVLKTAMDCRSIALSEFNNLDFRIFMVGLVLDLMRIGSVASGDIAFWDSFVGALVVKKDQLTVDDSKSDDKSESTS